MPDDLEARIRAVTDRDLTPVSDAASIVDGSSGEDERSGGPMADVSNFLSNAALQIADGLLGLGDGSTPEPVSGVWRVWTPDAAIALVEGDTIAIGRAVDADLTVADPRISRLHVAIELTEGRALVTDVGSRNGTEIRRGRARMPIGSAAEELADGDVIGTVDDVEIAVITHEESDET